MLTSFFGKSSPVNYLLLSVFIVIVAVIVFIRSNVVALDTWLIVKYVFVLIGAVFAMLLLDFIIRKNQLTIGNTFAIFLFSCFLAAIPSVFLAPKLIFTLILLLLAFRRIFSLASEKNSLKKVLDASLYIVLASFFYFPAIGFLLLLYLAILWYVGFDFKTFLVPIVGAFLVVTLIITYQLLVTETISWIYEWYQPISLDFSNYNALALLAPATILLSICIWTGFHKFYTYTTLAKKEKPKAKLILVFVLISVIVVIASPIKTGSEMLFLLPALSILAANYIAYVKPELKRPDLKATYWFKESLLWFALILPILGLVFLFP